MDTKVRVTYIQSMLGIKINEVIVEKDPELAAKCGVSQTPATFLGNRLYQGIPDETVFMGLVEKKKRMSIRRSLRTGRGYLNTTDPAVGWATLSDCTVNGYSGLGFTRAHPDEVLADWQFNGQLYWFTKRSDAQRGSLDPNDLDRIIKIVSGFVQISDPGMIHLTGLEYIYTRNGFSRMLELIQDINDIIMGENSLIFVSCAKDAWEPGEFRLMTSELKVLK